MKEKVILFGAGDSLNKSIVSLDYEYDILFICDNDKNKQGKEYHFKNWQGDDKTINIFSADRCKGYKEIKVIITIIKYESVLLQLEDLGVYNVESIGQLYTKSKYLFKQLLVDYISDDIKQNIGDWINTDRLDQIKKDVFSLWNNHYAMPNIVLNMNGVIDKDKYILDYGFGCGTLYLYLKTNGYKNVFGVDMDLLKYNFFKQKVKEKRFNKDWLDDLQLYDGKRLPYGNEMFDYIFCDQVLEHVVNIEDSLREMLRVVKKGGIIHIMCPNYNNSYEPHYYIEFKKKLKGNKKELSKFILENHGSTELIDNLNFVVPEDIIEVAKSIDGNVRFENHSDDVFVNVFLTK